MKQKLLFFVLILINSCLAIAQCPSPSDNFPNFERPNLTPSAAGETVSNGSTWGGDYHEIEVIAGETYKISLVNSEAVVAAAYPDNPNPQVCFDPILTVFDNSGTVGFANSTGAIIAFNDDSAPGNKFPELEFTATYTGSVYAFIDPAPGSIVQEPFYSGPNVGTCQTDNTTVATCNTFATDSTGVEVTWIDPSTLGIGNPSFADLRFTLLNDESNESITILNPSQAMVQNIEIYSLSGKKVKAIDLDNDNSQSQKVNVSNLSSGIYIMSINANYRSIKKKFLIK
ncbi:T9SS type A sorting domain-containing protein [Algibacter sp. 2305UL17-15]|uniref:T9SS type A sorting domain-containing protein n=1 Tax=Algibacter sp. 2305UL17-15 TaxID=3231268 RepID=UPI003458C845